MLEEKDKTLQNTLSGTSSGLKMRNTAEAQLRRKVVELNKRYGDAKKVAKALFLVDGYKADEIQGEQEQYDAIMSGQPMPKGGEEGRLEDRQRNVMHDHITARMNEKVEDTYGEIDELMFDPTDKGDIASLVRDMAIEYPDISYGEIKGAVYERVGQLSQDTVVEETTPEETTENQEQGDGFWKSKFQEFFGGGEDVFQPPQQQPQQEQQYPEGQPQKNPSGIYPQQQVKGARMDNFRQGVEDKLSKTMTIENTLGEPPSIEGVTAMQPPKNPSGVYPAPAEERYPDKTVESWDKPNDAVVKQTPGKYKDLIQRSADENGVPRKMLSAMLLQESNFEEDVISGKKKSPKGALGIAQFMPDTAKDEGVDPLVPDSAVPGAAKYLKRWYDKFGSWELALAAYNAGATNVSKYGGIPPFKETQNYVRKIMENYNS